ncbi:MAG: HAD hydrolase-like protein [Pirellulaceae bacterium]
MDYVVFLFDIDGTLVRSRRVGWRSIVEAVEQVFGVKDLPPVELGGRTDRGIFAEVLEALGEGALRRYSEFVDVYHTRLEANWQLPEFEVLPGVNEILHQIGQTDGAVAGLLTGNSPTGAKTKLKRAGIWEHFEFGGFGDTDTHRHDVARKAAIATRNHLPSNARIQLVTIGDTPADISCARAIDSSAVAVMTGFSSRAQLEDAKPDLLLENLCKLNISDFFQKKVS